MSNKTFADGAEGALAAILSVSGTELSQQEQEFFADVNPLGFILFSRNCETPKQLSSLTAALKETVGRECPIMIDQEGGRVQRMKPPRWREYPPARSFGELAEQDLDTALGDLRFTVMQLAEELAAVGVSVNCAPVLDVLCPDTHDAIGDRAFSEDPAIVSRLGVSVCRNLLRSAGITPVVKHMPGQGRATTDSHKDLPRVEAAFEALRKDFQPFKELSESNVAPAMWGMVAHVIYEAIDPQNPASVSEKLINEVIRGEIGFEGFLVSDDLDMDALKAVGDIGERAKRAVDAGCDAALYCSGKYEPMVKIAESVPKLSPVALGRLQKAAEFRKLAA